MGYGFMRAAIYFTILGTLLIAVIWHFMQQREAVQPPPAPTITLGQLPLLEALDE